MKYVAEITTETGFVNAVSELKEPLPMPPSGREFVVLETLEPISGKKYENGNFVDWPEGQ